MKVGVPLTPDRRPSVNFTSTSTPQVTALGGTVFAFVTSYEFVGFAAPVANAALNVAKGGQAIPLKRQLFDLGGNPVTDLAPATVMLTSVSIACAALTEGTDTMASKLSGYGCYGGLCRCWEVGRRRELLPLPAKVNM
jgi:hypothetical protein